MKILRLNVLKGANIFSYKPVLRIKLDLETLYDTPSKDIENFNENLLQIFPGLGEHKCSVGKKGGFVKRLQEGTYLAHIFEHVLIELQNICGDKVAYGKARATKAPSIYDVIAAYQNDRIAQKCALLTEKVLNSLIDGIVLSIEDEVMALKKMRADMMLGPSAQAIYEAAAKRNIPVERFGHEDLLLLGQGKHCRRIWSTVSDRTSLLATDLVGNKYLTARYLENNGVPVPKNRIAENEREAVLFAAELGGNVVIKPLNGSHGRGVTIGAQSEPALKKAFRFAAKYDDRVLIEEYVAGRQYRLCLINYKLAAASERIPAYVIGDGQHTVRELVGLANKNPLRGEGHDKPLTKIALDEAAVIVLAKQKLTPDEIPEVKRIVQINETANISTGGTAVDVTAIVHPDTVKLAQYAAQTIGLDIVGLDIISPDIAKPLRENGGMIIEVNAAPGIRMHHHPSAGQARDVGGGIIESLFPSGDGRIPVVAVTGTNGKTTTVRMIGNIFRHAGYSVGMTTTEGVFINDECLLKGDCSGPLSAKMVLANPQADMAVLETARGGIVRAGLGFDSCDVGLVTNISEDHLGQDGAETLDDLAYIKSLVLEVAKPSGAAVINADDAFVHMLASRVRAAVVYFSRKENNIIIRRHLGLGGKAVFLKENKIYLAEGLACKRLLHIDDLPVGFKGMAGHNVENALAAVSAAFAYGIDSRYIKAGLETFAHNVGRLNLFHFDTYSVCVDYGHNLAGYNAMIGTAQKMEHKRLVGVIAAPGDRNDQMIISLGMAAGKGFDYLYIKEDADRRGREAGETAQLLMQGAMASRFPAEQTRVVLSEREAVRQALANAQPGDFIIIFYEQYEIVTEEIRVFKEKRQAIDLPHAAEVPFGVYGQEDLRKNLQS